jgi:hypothetical protein
VIAGDGVTGSSLCSDQQKHIPTGDNVTRKKFVSAATNQRDRTCGNERSIAEDNTCGTTHCFSRLAPHKAVAAVLSEDHAVAKVQALKYWYNHQMHGVTGKTMPCTCMMSACSAL